MNLVIDEKYLTGPIANTDLHAGGLFFAIIYKKSLVFSGNEVVVISRELVEPFRPMDDQDVDTIKNYHFTGRYFFNSREYLECHFEEIGLMLTGLPVAKHSGMLVFHVYDKHTQRQWGEVFELETGK
ncbi:MAG TPA: hypothetical protein VK518_14410 [Puia sp.]|nr:hypothetical protein [Puia sp.]